MTVYELKLLNSKKLDAKVYEITHHLKHGEIQCARSQLFKLRHLADKPVLNNSKAVADKLITFLSKFN